MKGENYRKVRDNCQYEGEYIVAAHNIRDLKFNVLKKTTIDFYNESNYDYYFIKKDLV